MISVRSKLVTRGRTREAATLWARLTVVGQPRIISASRLQEDILPVFIPRQRGRIDAVRAT